MPIDQIEPSITTTTDAPELRGTLARLNDQPISSELLHRMDAYWRAANDLSVGQIYLYDNPLLKEPLKMAHVKPLVSDIGGLRRGRTLFMCI